MRFRFLPLTRPATAARRHGDAARSTLTARSAGAAPGWVPDGEVSARESSIDIPAALFEAGTVTRLAS
jgi:hypothetical protein